MSLPAHLQSLTKAQLESICVNCGACCMAAVEIKKGLAVIVPELACKHLAIEDGMSKCGVYEDRHTVAKGWCRSLEAAIAKGLLPNACPYVVDMPGYTGAVVLSENQYAVLGPMLKKAILTKDQPTWVDSGDWASYKADIDVHK